MIRWQLESFPAIRVTGSRHKKNSTHGLIFQSLPAQHDVLTLSGEVLHKLNALEVPRYNDRAVRRTCFCALRDVSGTDAKSWKGSHLVVRKYRIVAMFIPVPRTARLPVHEKVK